MRREPRVPSEVTLAIDRAREVFAQYRFTDPVAVCTHCTDDASLRRMTQIPVHDWPADLVEEHSFAVAVAANDHDRGDNRDVALADQLRAVLPRYLEHLAAGRGGPDLVFPYGALRYRETWPRHEIVALDDCWRALLRSARPDEIGDAAETVLSGGSSAALVIETIDTLPDGGDEAAIAALRLALWIRSGEPELYVYSEAGSCRQEADLVRDWLLSPEQEDRLDAAIAAAAELGDDARWDHLWRGREAHRST